MRTENAASEGGASADGRTTHRPYSKACSLCSELHDETIAILIDAEVRRIPDGDLEGETIYVERELLDVPGRREAALRHRLTVLKDEAQRRRRIAAKGGPLYRGRSEIPQERIREAKRGSVSELLQRDLELVWIRGNRTGFRCTAHGDGVDRHPSLIAYEDQGTWWCYVCNSGGDQIDWLIARHGMGFRAAVEALT